MPFLHSSFSAPPDLIVKIAQPATFLFPLTTINRTNFHTRMRNAIIYKELSIHSASIAHITSFYEPQHPINFCVPVERSLMFHGLHVLCRPHLLKSVTLVKTVHRDV